MFRLVGPDCFYHPALNDKRRRLGIDGRGWQDIHVFHVYVPFADSRSTGSIRNSARRTKVGLTALKAAMFCLLWSRRLVISDAGRRGKSGDKLTFLARCFDTFTRCILFRERTRNYILREISRRLLCETFDRTLGNIVLINTRVFQLKYVCECQCHELLSRVWWCNIRNRMLPRRNT